MKLEKSLAHQAQIQHSISNKIVMLCVCLQILHWVVRSSVKIINGELIRTLDGSKQNSTLDDHSFPVGETVVQSRWFRSEQQRARDRAPAN